MSPAVLGLGAAAAWFCVFAALQVRALRSGSSGPASLGIAMAVSAAGLLATILVFGRAYPAGAVALAMGLGLLAAACLFVLYVPALYTVLTSLSVQTLILLESRRDGLSEGELYGRYAGRALFEDRLRTLARSGYIAETGSGYRLTSRGRRLARPFAALKAFWRLGPGG